MNRHLFSWNKSYSGLHAKISIKKRRILKKFWNVNNCLSFIVCKMFSLVPKQIILMWLESFFHQRASSWIAAVDLHLSDKVLTCEYQEFLNDMLVHKHDQNQLQLYNHLSFDFYEFSCAILTPKAQLSLQETIGIWTDVWTKSDVGDAGM